MTRKTFGKSLLEADTNADPLWSLFFSSFIASGVSWMWRLAFVGSKFLVYQVGTQNVWHYICKLILYNLFSERAGNMSQPT